MAQPQTTKLILAGGLLGIAVVIFVINSGRTSGVRIVGAPYYDVKTGELFIGPTDGMPPIEAPSGDEGVRAFVFACGQCDDPLSGDIAYLVKYSDEVKEEIQALREKAQAASMEEQPALMAEAESYVIMKRLVAPPDASQWIVDDGTVEAQMTAALASKCGSEKLVPCRVSEK